MLGCHVSSALTPTTVISMSVDVITTPLKYFTPPLDGSKPWSNINADPATGVRDRNFELKDFKTQVENIRGKEGPSL